MRTLLLLACFIYSCSQLLAQSSPDNRIDIPHYVAIGPTCYTITAPTGYNLVVEGGVLTERLRVASRNGTNWADYVFEPSYPLLPLTQLEIYVNQNRHLPGIPSAQQVSQQGIDIGPMQATLLAKIEELTLYVIQQQKQLNHLRRQVHRLRKQSHSQP